MSEYKLPGLRIELPAALDSSTNLPAYASLGALLDAQQARFSEAALLGWRSLPADSGNLSACTLAAARLRSSCSELLLIGMGGSINGARAVYRALELGGSVTLALEFLDNPDPLTMVSVLETLDPEHCGVLAVSRSGNTLETVAMLAAALQHVPAEANSALALCCLAGDNPLGNLADERGWQRIELPADTGGRFSIFSAAGLVPLACSGIDIAALCRGAADCSARLEQLPLHDNPAWLLSGMLLQDAFAATVLYTYADCLQALGEWWRQLIGESIGQARDSQACGLLPICARGAADQHSLNQLFLDGPDIATYCFLSVAEPGFDISINRNSSCLPAGFEQLAGLEFSRLLEASRRGTLEALRDSGRPVAELRLAALNAESLGSIMQFWMHVTACLGERLGINPYEQPAVERSKRITNRLLAASGSD